VDLVHFARLGPSFVPNAAIATRKINLERQHCMSRILALAIASVAAAAAVLVPATAASANATPTCVTRAEYRNVHKGMTLDRVKRITGVAGSRQVFSTSGRYSSQIRNFKTCSQFSVVTMSFDKTGANPWHMTYKSAVWVG
jgi:hypothetical protein